jgi:hypothetical protein
MPPPVLAASPPTYLSIFNNKDHVMINPFWAFMPTCYKHKRNKTHAALLAISLLSVTPSAFATHPNITPEMLHALTTLPDSEKLRIGDRISNVEDEINRLLPQLTLAEKVSLVHAAGKFHIVCIQSVLLYYYLPALGLDMSSEQTLWRDEAFLYLNKAILKSFQVLWNV